MLIWRKILRLNPITREAYRWLYRLATDSVDPHAPEIWQAWEQVERDLAAQAHISPLHRSVGKTISIARNATCLDRSS
jgi:ferric-dicitrate binding protein FerR (iron transport regulator)